MTRRDYIKFAKLLKRTWQIYGFTQDVDLIRYFEKEIANIFARDNRRFKRREFYRACHGKSSKKPTSHKKRVKKPMSWQDYKWSL